MCGVRVFLMKNLLLFLIIVSLPLLLGGCGEKLDKAIVGKWERQGIIFIFNEYGTCEISSNGKTIDTGTWSIKSGKIHTVNSGEFGPRGRVVIYSLSAEGHLQPPSGGSVFKKIK